MEKQKMLSIQKASSTVNNDAEDTPSCHTLIHLCMHQQEREEQHRTLSAKNEELERDVESLKTELQTERLSKERELRKMTSKREKEAAEYKEQLAFITQKLEVEKRKSPPVQEVMPGSECTV